MGNTRKTKTVVPGTSVSSGPTDHLKPELLGKGRYSIYQDPSGDGIISYRPEGQDADNHQVVPARIWSLILGALRGEITDMNPMSVMKMLMSAGK